MIENNKIIEAAMAELNSNPEWSKFVDSYKEKYRKVLKLSLIIYSIGILIIISPILIIQFLNNFNINQHLSVFLIGGLIFLVGIVYYIMQGMVLLPRAFNKISRKMYSDAVLKAS